MSKRVLLIAGVVLCGVLFSRAAQADEIHWTAGTATWHDAMNWSPSSPTSYDDVIIDNGGTAQISAAAESFILYVGESATGGVEQSGGTNTVT